MLFGPLLTLYQARGLIKSGLYSRLGCLMKTITIRCVRLERFKTCRTIEAKAALVITALELHLHQLLFRPCHRPFDCTLQLRKFLENKRGRQLYLDMILVELLAGWMQVLALTIDHRFCPWPSLPVYIFATSMRSFWLFSAFDVFLSTMQSIKTF